MKQIIISSAQGGLSNRLKCLINSFNLSEKLGWKVVLYWPKDEACNCEFEELFDKKIKKISKEDLRKILKDKNYEYYDDSSKKIKGGKKFIILNLIKTGNFKKGYLNLLNVNLPSKKFNPKLRKIITNTFLDLKPKKEIISKANNFFNKKLDKDSIGLHIRKGDFVNLKSEICLISPSKEFEKIISKELIINPKIKIFLSTDSFKEEINLKKIFGKKIIICPKKTKNRGEEGAVKEALIDLMILSKTDKIYGTYGSTFNELASWINPAVVREVLFDKKELSKYLQQNKSQKKIMPLIKKIIYEFITPFHKRFLDIK